MSIEEIEKLFALWWAESYGNVPGPHARMTHAGFAKWLLDQVQSEADAA